MFGSLFCDEFSTLVEFDAFHIIVGEVLVVAFFLFINVGSDMIEISESVEYCCCTRKPAVARLIVVLIDLFVPL